MYRCMCICMFIRSVYKFRRIANYQKYTDISGVKKKRLLRKFQLFETYAVQGNLLRQYLIVICRFSNIKKEINSGELGHSSGGVFICKTHYIWNCRSKGAREGGALSNWSKSKRISLKNCWQYLANNLWIMFFYLFVMNSLCYIQRQYGREVCDFFFL